MRDTDNLQMSECESLEREIRSMCNKLKLAAPPSEYSLEDAIEKVIGSGMISAADPEGVGLIPAFGNWCREFCRSLSSAITMRRLSNVASSIIVILMLMIIPLALFSNRSMAMNSDSAAVYRDRGSVETEEDLKVECTKYLCGDKRYEQ